MDQGLGKINYLLISSDLGNQKYSLSVDDFLELRCPLGSIVKVTTYEGTFICKVYPNSDLKNDSVVEKNIQLFSQRQKFIIMHPLCGAYSVVRLCTQKAVTSVTVTIVVKKYRDVSTLKKSKLSGLVKSLLSNKIFTQLSSVNVAQSSSTLNIEKILILDIQPKCEAGTINSKTQIRVECIITSKWMDLQEKIQSTHVGGLQDAYSKLQELVVYPIQYPNVFAQLRAPRGILLYGPPGSGKSSIIHKLCAEFCFFLVPVTCSDLSSSEPGGSEVKLRNIFKECMNVSSPTILFLDGVDSICPKRGNQSHTNRLIVCLTKLIDKIDYHHHNLIIMAATNRLEDVDLSLRRPGRLDREIHLSAPNLIQRQEIITAVCKNLLLDSQSEDIELVAEMTPGYVGADLNLLCRETLYLSQNQCQPTNRLEKIWMEAIGRVRPSIMRGNAGIVEFRRVNWEDVGGLEEARTYIRRSVEWPLKYPKAFGRLNVPRPKGVLIYGPPGCGKSLLVRAAATSCAASFFSISAAELFSPFVGDSEKMVSELFRRAREATPSILFLDELDAMVGGRSNVNPGRTAGLGVVAALLQEMDGISSSHGVVVVGATNRPDKIDDALLRPGRFDSLVYIPNPDQPTRLAILNSHCRKMPLKHVDLDELSRKTNLFSGADLESLTKEAALGALEEDLSADCILQKHFIKAFTKVPASFTLQHLEFYHNYALGKRKFI